MFVISAVFRFYLNASIHVALAVVSLYLVTTIDLNIVVNPHLIGFLFCATVVCYNFVKYGVEAEKYLIVAKPYHKPIQVFSFLIFGASLYFIQYLKFILWIFILLFTFLSALYAIPFLPNSKNLRSLAGLKIFLIALIWAGFTVVLPLVDNQMEWNMTSWTYIVQRFLLVLVLILPFEIRDLQYDTPDLKTLPQRFGIMRTKYIGYCMILVYFLMTLLRDGLVLSMVLQEFFLCILLVVVLYSTEKQQQRYFSSFWVEGIPIFWVTSLILLKTVF